MTNQLTDIQSQIESFLQTNPESEAVETFRVIYKQLASQGISVKHAPELSDERQESWKLEDKKTGECGRLMWFRSKDWSEWEMHDFKLVDKTGEELKEFWDVIAYY